jgi:hypothetical protein
LLLRRFGEVAVRGVHLAELVRRRGVEAITRPEEVSMHPKMMIAAANEVQRDRESERQWVQLRSLALANRARGFDGSRAASGFARRLLDGISLRPRLS